MIKVEGRESSVEGQQGSIEMRAFSTPRASRGVTLIELLIVVTIISILTALVLGVAAVAGETQREQHTKHVVQRLHTLMNDYYGTLKSRRVRLNASVESLIDKNTNLRTSEKGQAKAEARLYAMREMLLMEVPDRWSDVILERVEDFDPSPSTAALAPIYLSERTELSNVYFRRFRQLVGRTNTLTGATNTADEIRRNQGAECLYMIVTTACGDGEARTLFGESTISDVDGDGAPEFVDGWGHPINFLRWAPGFESSLQSYITTSMTLQARASLAVLDHDPFDMFRIDPAAFRLAPLIYSPGRDEESGLNAAPDFVTWRITPSNVSLGTSAPFIKSPILTPFVLAGTEYMGTPTDTTATDNIHNHLLGKR